MSGDQLPQNYPADYVKPGVLKDGTLVLIRPIRPDDAPRLQEGMHRLSAQSIYLRFLKVARELSAEQALQLATIDYQERMAFIATIEQNAEELLIGVARYTVLKDRNPRYAEAAIVVMDEYQRRGAGLLLLERLTEYAMDHGIDTYLATVHLANQPMLRFIQNCPYIYERSILEPGIWEILVHLDQRRPDPQT